jgi:hypothetical protein
MKGSKGGIRTILMVGVQNCQVCGDLLPLNRYDAVQHHYEKMHHMPEGYSELMGVPAAVAKEVKQEWKDG